MPAFGSDEGVQPFKAHLWKNLDPYADEVIDTSPIDMGVPLSKAPKLVADADPRVVGMTTENVPMARLLSMEWERMGNYLRPGALTNAESGAAPMEALVDAMRRGGWNPAAAARIGFYPNPASGEAGAVLANAHHRLAAALLAGVDQVPSRISQYENPRYPLNPGDIRTSEMQGIRQAGQGGAMGDRLSQLRAPRWWERGIDNVGFDDLPGAVSRGDLEAGAIGKYIPDKGATRFLSPSDVFPEVLPREVGEAASTKLRQLLPLLGKERVDKQLGSLLDLKRAGLSEFGEVNPKVALALALAGVAAPTIVDKVRGLFDRE